MNDPFQDAKRDQQHDRTLESQRVQIVIENEANNED